MLRSVAVLPLVVLSFVAQANNPPCPPLPAAPYCVPGTHAWLYGADAEQTRILAGDLEQNAILFQRYFGRPIPRLAIILGDAESLDDATRQHLLDQGADAVMAWPDADAFSSMRASSENQDDPASRLLASQPGLQQAIWRNVTRHELGHVAFNLAYWPGVAAGRGHGHSRSPDWLNEMVAMLLEPDASADHRRRYMATAVAEATTTPLPTLRQLLAMQNPARPKNEKAPSEKGVSLVYRSNEDAGERAASTLYYAQLQALADFLLATSRSPDVFGSLAGSIASGRSMEEWLRADAAAFGLPADFDALDQAWTAWLSTER